MDSNLAPLIGMLGLFTMVAWVVWVIVDGRRRRERVKVVTEFHQRLLDRIGSAREFGEFLQTDGGNRFVASLAIEKASPKERIVRSIQTGVILIVLGSALLLLAWLYPYEIPFRILGILVLALGVGFVSSSLVAYRLSTTWGLLDESKGSSTNPT